MNRRGGLAQRSLHGAGLGYGGGGGEAGRRAGWAAGRELKGPDCVMFSCRFCRRRHSCLCFCTVDEAGKWEAALRWTKIESPENRLDLCLKR